MRRLQELGDVGREDDGRLSRLALSDQDKAGRDLVCHWMRQSGLTISIDAIGNIFGTWGSSLDQAPLMMGSHIDSVINSGIYDGCYGVLSGLSVIEALQKQVDTPKRPVTVAIFTNEEGVRYAPDMMGSLVYAGGYSLNDALATEGTDGTILDQELRRIGYAGPMLPGSIIPHAFLEVHVEQGPILEAERIDIGAVENLQGISWQRITIEGTANHAGTTPMRLRHDAGHAAAQIMVRIRDFVTTTNDTTVVTVGTMSYRPNAINVIPAKVVFTVDLRDPTEHILQSAEDELRQLLKRVSCEEGVTVKTERLARFEPVQFDQDLVKAIEQSSALHKFTCRRMTSGAGHDAQMMSRICPSAMIFVPSRDGISHNPKEHTDQENLIKGANVLLTLAKQYI